MKKIFTLAMMAFVFCLSASAEIVLGDIQFSLGEGKKISPTTGKINVLFPNVTGVDVETTEFEIAGTFNESDFDGLSGLFSQGVTLELADFELTPSTDYTLTISSVKVGGEELAPAEGYVLHFKTRSAERKMAWNFVPTEDEMTAIKADADGEKTYWDVVKANERYWIHQSLKDSEIMLDANNILSVTEDLTFYVGSDKLYIGDISASSWKGILCFNATNMKMTIPDCKVGDVITFSGVNSTKGNASKQTCIYTMNGDALAPEGLESSRGYKDSIWVSAKGTFKFEAQVDGDIAFYFGNFRMTSIEITEAQPKVARKYNIVAQYQAEESEAVVLKELVPSTEGVTGSTIKTNYPYWLTDADGNAYTYGTKGSEFVQAFDLKNGETESDTTFVINYKKTDYTGVVYLSEGEDIPEAVLCTNANAAVRSSMGKSGYVTEDTKLVTLQPGTYKIRAILFDANKTPGYICTLSKGAGEENEIYLTATSTNWTEAESDLLTITEATDITLKAGGSDNTGLDVIMIYASVDAPDDPEGIVEVKSAQKVAARKVMKDGRILIQTEGGIFNAIGVQVK